jgi:hypothetical protein
MSSGKHPKNGNGVRSQSLPAERNKRGSDHRNILKLYLKSANIGGDKAEE